MPTDQRIVQRTGTALGAIVRTFKRGYEFISDKLLLGSWAEYIVQHFNVPRPLLSVLQRADDEATKDKLFQANISDRQTITDTVFPWSTHVDQDFFIESIEHEVDIEGVAVHETRWKLTDFLADQFFIWGTSKWDDDTVWGY